MSTVAQAAQALEDALRQVDGLRVYRDPSHNIDPPAVILGPPSLGFATFASGVPTEARFSAWLVVHADEYTLETLWDWVPQVAAAVETAPDTVLANIQFPAQPTTFRAAGVDLPAYEIQTDVAL